ncbi:hypothetical protein KM043_006709 [Ampulex compressa]|nr:hypothetical protein KM043_006709 [Ampulex compressa]
MGKIQNTTKQIIERKKVVIIGAGIAGLAAAKTLEDANFKNYLLLEAQERIGGRIHSIPWNKSWIECGAQFLHGDQSSLGNLCVQNKLLSNIEGRDSKGTFYRGNGIKVNQSLVKEIDDFVSNTLEDCEKFDLIKENCESIGKILNTRFTKYLKQAQNSDIVQKIKKEIFGWNVKFLMIDNSCVTLDQLSAKNWGKFKFAGGSEHLLFKTGYNSITNLIANSLKKENIRVNTAVELIEWQQCVYEDESDRPLILTLSDKTQIIADCVIVTCSLGYLKEHYKHLFTPPLPLYLSTGIESLGFGVINKIILDFGTSWWDKNTEGFQFVWRESAEKTFCNESLASWTRDCTGFDVLPDHNGILLGWVGGYGACIVETLTEDQVAIDCANLLKYYLKLNNMPTIKRCVRTKWRTNKYVRGGYSHIPVCCDYNGVTPGTLLKPVWGTIIKNNRSQIVPIIMLAGEATHDHFYSTTHGAYETGIKQAKNFLRHHVNKS